MPVSRPDFLRQVFTNLEMMECDRAETNILVLVDGDLQLYEVARNLTVQSKFAQKLCVYRRRGQANVGSIYRRRQRIADIHNELKELIDKGDYFFLIEDDSLIPSSALKKLMSVYLENPHAGMVTGVQLGRWGYTVPGVWKTNDVYDVSKIESMEPKEGVEEIDAAGLYCCLTRKDNYMRHTFQPFEKLLGPDFFWGLWLRQQGLTNYVDWSIKVDHLTKRGKISLYNTPIQKITFMRGIEEVWEQEVIDL